MVTFHPGRLPNNPDKPRLLLKNYLDTSVPTYPASADWLSSVKDWPMYLNDRLGDCTCAGIAHILQAVSTYGQGNTVTVTDSDVLTAYEAVSGYDPRTGDNDNGAVMQDVLSYWRKTGIAGHKILAFAEVDYRNQDELKAALYTFGHLYIGINFPASAMDQFNEGKPWDYVRGSQNEGGHAINGGFYQDGGNWKVVTWGQVQEMTQEFWDHYVEEAWVVITPEWLNEQGKSPTGLDLQTLGQDLADITGGANPFPAPTPDPVPTPTPSPQDADTILEEYLKGWFAAGHKLPGHPHLEAMLTAWLDSRG
jgi:hypothetical protein